MESGRRSHRKSRKGCVQCKRRKIKCDETKPSCQNCLRHKTQCLFVSTGSPSSAQPNSPAPTTPLQSGVISSGNDEDSDQLHGRRPSIAGEFSMVEMELLHNYSTYTCYTLERNPNGQTVWRVNIPQIGFSFPFVMNAILALSALHLAHSRPAMKNHYVTLAQQHHERGLEQVNALLPNITEANATALCIFSALTGIISFAKPRRPGDFLLIGQEGIADWLMLFRGTKHIIDTYKETLASGGMSQMFHMGFRRLQRWQASSDDRHEALEELLQSLKAVSTDEKELEVYKKAIRELGQSFSLVANSQVQTTETADVFIWFFEVSNDFLALLYSRAQAAIAIFGFYCVLLKQMEWSWYMKGWSTHLISIIWKNLDQQHKVWIQWPLEQIGWIPN